jgi:hypothetical protein
MYHNQVLNIFNVGHPLLKFIFFDINRPMCDACGFVRENLPKISLNLIFIFLKKEKKRKKNWVAAGATQWTIWGCSTTPIWFKGG